MEGAKTKADGYTCGWGDVSMPTSLISAFIQVAAIWEREATSEVLCSASDIIYKGLDTSWV